VKGTSQSRDDASQLDSEDRAGKASTSALHDKGAVVLTFPYNRFSKAFVGIFNECLCSGWLYSPGLRLSLCT
jgi:hypothetical protein